MTFKRINELAPDYLACNFHADIHTRNTRSRNNLNIPRYRTTSGQHSFKSDLKSEGNLSKFKKDIKLACLATWAYASQDMGGYAIFPPK